MWDLVSCFHLCKVEYIFYDSIFPFILFGINCRRVKDRPKDAAKWTEIGDVVAALSIPVIANGDVFEYADFERLKSDTGNYNTYSIYLMLDHVMYVSLSNDMNLSSSFILFKCHIF